MGLSLVRILRSSEIWNNNSADIWDFNLNITFTVDKIIQDWWSHHHGLSFDSHKFGMEELFWKFIIFKFIAHYFCWKIVDIVQAMLVVWSFQFVYNSVLLRCFLNGSMQWDLLAQLKSRQLLRIIKILVKASFLTLGSWQVSWN